MQSRFFHIPSTKVGLDFFNSNESIRVASNFNPRHQDLLEYKPQIPWLNYLENLRLEGIPPTNWIKIVEGIMDVTYRLNNRYYEKIFEEIRLNHYQNLPSRYICLYLADEESLEYWYKKAIEQLNTNSLTIFELEEVEIITHYADPEWLEVGIVSEAEYIDVAHAYWKGEKKNSDSVFEILATGEFRIKTKYSTITEI
jgi:hypothetical protein